MKTCPACGTQYSDDLSFCLKDGNRLSGGTTFGLTNNPTEPLPTQPATAYRQDLSTQETVASQPGQVTPTRQATKGFRFSAVDPKTRMGCIVTVGQVSAILLLVFGLGLGIVYYNLQGRSDVAYSEPSPAVTNNTSSASNTMSTGNATSNSGFPGQTANANTVRSTPSPTTKTTPTVAATPEASPTVLAKPTVTPKPSPSARPTILDSDNTAAKPTPRPRPTTVRFPGPLNSQATFLPAPAYPPAARAVRASGPVRVQILIDEDGNVISASAVSGHPLLQAAAVSAARRAKFHPTLLNAVPVKVSGVITYNFIP